MSVDRHINTIQWLDRLARVAKDTGKTLSESCGINKWVDVNALLANKNSLFALMCELEVMVKMVEMRQAELKAMLDDKV